MGIAFTSEVQSLFLHGELVRTDEMRFILIQYDTSRYGLGCIINLSNCVLVKRRTDSGIELVQLIIIAIKKAKRLRKVFVPEF